LQGVNSEIDGLKEVIGKAGEYSNEIQQLTKGNLSELKELPKTAETKAEELSGLTEVKDQTQVLNEYKDIAANMQNSDSLKTFLVQKARQVAVNHFAGKEKQLKEAMETIAKCKSKFSSVTNISEITKRPPNEVKGKPFIERIIPGIAFQIQKERRKFVSGF
jgi:uncharacterized phage infection (PIP) family protein YhgE